MRPGSRRLARVEIGKCQSGPLTERVDLITPLLPEVSRISATRFKVGFALSLSVKERERERRDRERKKNKECVCVRGREREGERKRQCKPLFQTVLGILEKLILKYLVTLVGSPKLMAPTTTVQKKRFTTVQQIFSRLPSRLGNDDDSDGARRQRRRRQRSQQRLLCMHLHACINPASSSP